jgi:hypothetical protein
MRTWTLLSITAAAALLGISGRAAAQECASDDDCVASYTCEVVGESGCGFACPEGSPDCKPPPDADCEVMEYKACVPGPCSSDADCEDGMVCFEQESVSCPPSAEIDCPPGADCPKPEPVDCETSTTTSCVPRYAVPCEDDADCGDGFDCVEDIAYACAGSAPSSGGGSEPGDPGAAGGAAPEPEPLPLPPDEPPSCTEEPAGTFHCEAREVECEADGDCPTDWTCQENYSRPVCGGAMIDPAAPQPPDSASCPDALPANCRVCADGSCGGAECVDGSWKLVCPEDAADEPGATPPVPPEEIPVDDCGVDPSVPARICAPPFADLGWGGVGIAEDGIAASGTAGGVPASDPQAPGAAPVPDRADEPAAGDDDKNVSLGDGETAEEPKADSGGLCAVSAPGAASDNALSLFGVLGLSLLGLRRKRHS